MLRGQDLNLRPLGYEPSELPNCSTPRYVEKITTGFGRQLPFEAKHCIKRGNERRIGRCIGGEIPRL